MSPSKQELIRDVHYLKTENQRLRYRLPKTIWTTPEERRDLVKAARGISKETLRQLVSIVSPATFLRWMNADKKPKPNKQKSVRSSRRMDGSRLLWKLVVTTAFRRNEYLYRARSGDNICLPAPAPRG